MNKPVIDACVAIKWFLPEKDHESASKVLNQFPEFLAPGLFLIEIDAILTKKIRKIELEIDEAEILYHEIRKLPFKYIEYTRISKLSFDLSATLPITLYDATYLSVAMLFDEEVITADERFYRGMKGTPFKERVRALKQE